MNSPPVVAAAAPPVLVLRGSPALSAFRLDKLRQSLMQAHPAIGAIDSAFVHFVHTTRALDDRDSAILHKLLTYGGANAPAYQGETFLVIPRIGTISPWASKATNIARNCGLESVHRIERGALFAVHCQGGMTAQIRNAVTAAIHDPMTETVRFSLDDAAELFVGQAPAPLAHVPVMAGGNAAKS